MSEPVGLLLAQRDFMAAVRSAGAQQAALSGLAGDTARNQNLLAVYRGNAVANASKALGLAYPVIEKVVGEAFFAGVCRAFWAESPSQSGDLNEYGAGFSDFLAHFPHVAELPYLPDVATVEWHVVRATHAADHSPVALAQLAAVAPEAMGDLRFSLQESLVLIASAWPLASIWQQHQADYLGEVDIDLENAESIVVYRQGLAVNVVALSAAAFAFWQGAQAGKSLAEMLEAAFAIDEAFEVQGTLLAGFTSEFVIALHVE